MSKYRDNPTPPESRVAALRYQAERLLQDAATWGYVVIINPARFHGPEIDRGPVIQVFRHESPTAPHCAQDGRRNPVV